MATGTTRRVFCHLGVVISLHLLVAVSTSRASCTPEGGKFTQLERQLVNYVEETLNVDKYNVIAGITIERRNGTGAAGAPREAGGRQECDYGTEGRSVQTFDEYVERKYKEYVSSHVVTVKLPETARFFNLGGTGKSSFLTGFGMGFLAFALKKLLLPLFIGGQIVKSVLIAMFLPSILGGLGKLVGKGLSTFSGVSGASGANGGGQQVIDDFDFKDMDAYNANNQDMDINGAEGSFSFPATDTNSAASESSTPGSVKAMSRYGPGGNRISYMPSKSDNYYARQPNKHTDFKVFHKIPSSSLLLTNYDPFYSPLLSRLDSVFVQLGLGDTKDPETEKCRERIVCMMYANPAKYAPYSNLVSAQLSRELNELRKPTSDNQDILRFFKYMKAAKDGQDGEECLAHRGCSQLSSSHSSPAMLTTFNHINKLVQARRSF